MVGAFPDGNSVLMLVAARLRHVAGTKGGTRCYLDSERDQGSEGSQRGRMTATLETMDLITSPRGGSELFLAGPAKKRTLDVSMVLE